MFERLIQKKYFAGSLAFCFYLFLTLLLTYPLINNFFKALPGNGGDSFVFVWNNWWVKYSLFNLGQNPYFTEYLAYPFRVNLVFHSLTFFNSLVSLPLSVIFNQVAAFNTYFIFSLVFASLSMYALLRYLFNSFYLALSGGVLFVFNSYIYGEMTGHFNYTTIFLIPLFVLFYLKIFNEREMKNSLFAAAVLSASFYNDFYYTIGLLIFALIYACWRLAKDKIIFGAIYKKILLFVVVWLLLSSPLLFLSVKASLSGAFPQPNLKQINLYSPDIRSLIIPSTSNIFWGASFQNHYDSLRFHGGIIYLSFCIILLALFGYFYGKEKPSSNNSKFWLISSISFLFLTLGPFLYLDGYMFRLDGEIFTIPLPYIALYFVPFFKGILVPARFIIFLIFSLIILGGFFLETVYSKLGDRKILKSCLAAAIMGVFILENLSIPIPVSSADVPEFYHRLAGDKGDYALLELPFALSTSFYTLGGVTSSSKLEYYQTIHHKKILGGWISRVPDSYYNFYNGSVGLNRLLNPFKKPEAQEIVPVKENIRSDFAKLNIGYIIIHPEYYNHQTLRNSVDYLNLVYDRKPELIDNLLVYKIN
jgi:hypothetical protein